MAYIINHKYKQDINVSAGEGSWTKTFAPEHEDLVWLTVVAPDANYTFDVCLVDEDTDMEVWGYSIATGSMGEKLGFPLTGTYSIVITNASNDGVYELQINNHFRR
jgi:hypothetical protein